MSRIPSNIPIGRIDSHLKAVCIGLNNTYPTGDTLHAVTSSWAVLKGFNRTTNVQTGYVKAKVPSGFDQVFVEVTLPIVFNTTSTSANSLYAQVRYSTNDNLTNSDDNMGTTTNTGTNGPGIFVGRARVVFSQLRKSNDVSHWYSSFKSRYKLLVST